MSARARFLTLLPLTLLLAACGGSSSSSPPTSSTARTTSTSSQAAATSTTTSSSSTSSSSPPASTRSSTTNPPAATPGSGRSAGGSTNVRVPATFVIGPGGRLRPPTVSVPAFLAVALTISSGDGSPHRVLVRTPSPHALAVPAHGRRTLRLGGLKAGQYAIDVDGRRAGGLIIGGEPGP